ncbi:hypothetical protein HII13_004806 [Brettanomyces bruxellensis]|uniref:Uncharacterized protein n=1 Tax=Dekkera bruxellensis TaxID=5007 RepID=A0A8H6BEI8_DEKBR|nr:hypothetical protein HII13_004806 [Brettanomyces bruxellensis]KAF6010142.1 hypothetical protein HII12_003017 [Brettanomyces bruxellensis]KAF6010305.1 hypothetical protein HII12_003012 [Brettanomyces bruxellensis]
MNIAGILKFGNYFNPKEYNFNLLPDTAPTKTELLKTQISKFNLWSKGSWETPDSLLNTGHMPSIMLS